MSTVPDAAWRRMAQCRKRTAAAAKDMGVELDRPSAVITRGHSIGRFPMTLNPVCDGHGHDPGLPDEPLRAHALAAALRAAERVLDAHGYGDPERSAEILHVALEDAHDQAAERGTDRWRGR